VSWVGLAAIAVFALPLCAAVANGVNALTGDRLYGHATVSRVAVAAVFGSFLTSVAIAVAMVVRPDTYEVTVYRFIRSGDFVVDFGLLLDPLSVVMMLVVTGISALVTYFSVNYMHNEDGFTRYFTVVSLFVFAMLVLVMADNYVVMFLGWEGVGICSYLLIGFYRDRPASAQAATRAFVMNRVGDAGLLLAMFLLVVHTGGVRYEQVFADAPSLPRGVAEAIGFLLLLGATGKSAQLPLGTWLARAMEGPTPSSALMHAATMVTAGVYLVVRSAPIYENASSALVAVGIVGAATALYGQLVGYVQTDIKGLLAASTTAQLGLMFLFCGLGLYAVAIFHLVAHAFYKSYLFLTAPSILHHLHDGADPTAVSRPRDTARLAAGAALVVAAGLLVVPLVGRVVESAGGGGITANLWVVLALAAIAVFGAVFSTQRMTAVAFADHAGHGDHDERAVEKTGNPLARVLVPLVVLAGLVAVGLAVDVLPGGLQGSWFQRLLDPVTQNSPVVPPGHLVLWLLFAIAIGLLLLSGWFGPRYLDRFRDELPPEHYKPAARRVYWWALGRGYLDEWFDRAMVVPALALGRALERFDLAVIDRPVTPGARGRPAQEQPARWEERFVAVREAHARATTATGVTALAEPPERLDWLAAGPVAAVHSPQDRPQGAGPRMGAAAKRASAWSERAASEGGVMSAGANAAARLAERIERGFFERTEGRGVIGAAADAAARLAEGTERVAFQRAEGHGVLGATGHAFALLAEKIERSVFQPVDTGALKLTSLIAGITDAVERVVFQSGVERGVTSAAAGSQRLLLATEERLGRPLVIGSICALALVAVVVGTA